MSSFSTRKDCQAQLLSFGAQSGYLRPGLRRGDNLMSVPGQADSGSFAEPGSGAGNQYRSCHCSLLPCLVMGNDLPGRKAADPALAISKSCATWPPDTPIAPSSSPPGVFSGMPPAKVTRPPLVVQARAPARRVCNFPNGLCLHLEENRCLCLLHRDIDRAKPCAVHAGKRLEVSAGVEHHDRAAMPISRRFDCRRAAGPPGLVQV